MKITYLILSLLLSGSFFTGLNAVTILHSFDFNDTTGTTLQNAANTGTIGGAFTAFTSGSPTAATTAEGMLRLTHDGTSTQARLNTGLSLPTEMPLHQMVTIGGWNMAATGSQIRISFMNALEDSSSAQFTTELRFTRNADGDVNFDVVAGGTGGAGTINIAAYDSLTTESLTFRTEFDWSSATASFSQLLPDSTWSILASNLTVGTSASPPGVRDAMSSQIRLEGDLTVDIDSFSVTAIPEPRTYALMLGVLAIGLVGFRRLKAQK